MQRVILIILSAMIFSCVSIPQNPLNELLTNLENSSEDTFDDNFNQIAQYIANNPTYENGVTILNSLDRDYPRPEFALFDTTSILVDLLEDIHDPQIIHAYKNAFSNASEDTQWEIIEQLTYFSTAEAVETVISLLKSTESSPIQYISFKFWYDYPEMANEIFPEILPLLLIEEYQHEILYLLITYLYEADINYESISDNKDKLIKVLTQCDQSMENLNLDKSNPHWFYNEEYTEYQDIQAIVLDALGFIIDKQIIKLLRSYSNSDDPRISFFAVDSLMWNDFDVSEEILATIAKDNEMRKLLFNLLSDLDKIHLLDEELFHQVELAKSDMVNWLVYPTELGTAPDEILFEQIIAVEIDGEMYDFYLFKFKMNPPHWAAEYGWMAGVSGPFYRAGYPTLDPAHYTFSTFSSWNEKSPEEHLQEVINLINEM